MNPTPNRIRVKICGITNPQDALDAIEAGADALGFNGFPGSKRFLDLATASPWMAQLPPFVTRVAVLVNPTLAEAVAVQRLPGVDRLQFHGDETPEFCASFSQRGFIKALAAKDRSALGAASRYGASAILLDAFVPGAYGGTGSLIDLELAAAFVRENPGLRVILSGGLTPENVAAAVRTVRPHAVDVASGVESHSCKKDRGRMRALIAALRENEALAGN
ncbi:MAG: phosphoribosylanthranilate isomerase [Verrucomicrobia bacterium]|nr:phosphoribosylanthranilate isomerase [Verrucomicrobiota bacterium]